MRLLVNENFPSDAVTALQQDGHDVVWVRRDAPGSRDEDVLERARTENRILITFDKDFGELAFRSQLPVMRHHFISYFGALGILCGSCSSCNRRVTHRLERAFRCDRGRSNPHEAIALTAR